MPRAPLQNLGEENWKIKDFVRALGPRDDMSAPLVPKYNVTDGGGTERKKAHTNRKPLRLRAEYFNELGLVSVSVCTV